MNQDDIKELKDRINHTIEEWAASPKSEELKAQEEKPTADTETTEEPVKAEKPKDKNKRIARSPATGDKVYLLDEKEKTKHWVTTEKILNNLGYSLTDVEALDDAELGEYRLGAAIYR